MHGSMNARRRLWRASFGILPGHCVLCRAASRQKLDLCRPCESKLPRLGPHCQSCAVPLILTDADIRPGNSRLRCGRCQTKPPRFDAVIAPYLYAPPLDRLLSRFKFNGDLVAGHLLGELLVGELRARLHAAQTSDGGIPGLPERIIPTPLHWRRQLFRGFNQARMLADLLASALHVPVADGLIKRNRATQAQRHLTRDERGKNVKHAFTLASHRATADIEGQHFAVVDDILTTGSTAEAVAALLKKHGAAAVDIWAVARTPLEN